MIIPWPSILALPFTFINNFKKLIFHLEVIADTN